MTQYDLIDPEFYAWAASHGLQVYNWYHDGEVRTVFVTSPSGKKCQIWVDLSTFSAFVISVWDHKKRKVELRATKFDISKKLEEAYQTALSWLET
jgi:hypothetical protein